MRIGRAAIVAGAASLLAGVAITAAPPAGATFPGGNGKVAFVTTRAGGGAPAIFQVDPDAPAVGTPAGNVAATTQLTGASNVDAEPFYSPDGATVLFSSNRSGRFAIYSLPANSSPDVATQTDSAALLSQALPADAHDDFAPSMSPDGHTVVFNRDNAGLWTLDLSAPDPAATAQLLYATGLATASSDNGAGSRPVFDPTDPSRLLYVGADNHIHLLSGIGSPSLSTTDLSAATGITANAADANPDWKPDGSQVVFDSTRLGGRKLFTLDPTATLASPIAAVALWPSWSRSDTQPVYSPDGLRIAYTEAVAGSSVLTNNVVSVGAPASTAINVSSVPAGTPQNSQPSWAPGDDGPPPVVPEAPLAVLLPGAALLVGGITLEARRRRLSAVVG